MVLTQPRQGPPLPPPTTKQVTSIFGFLQAPRTGVGRDKSAPPCALGAVSPENTGLSACFPNLSWLRVSTATTQLAGPARGQGLPGGVQGWQEEAGDAGSGQKNSRCVFHTHAVKCPVPSLTKGLAPPSAGPSAFPRLAPRPLSLASGDAPPLVHSINVARPGSGAGPGRGWAGLQPAVRWAGGWFFRARGQGADG